jgi:hypothetical protein
VDDTEISEFTYNYIELACKVLNDIENGVQLVKDEVPPLSRLGFHEFSASRPPALLDDLIYYRSKDRRILREVGGLYSAGKL